MGTAFVCSWSGGKESCLALYHAICAGAHPQFLFTMLDERGLMAHTHGIGRSILQAQALSLNIPLLTKQAHLNNYVEAFTETLDDIKAHGVETLVLGDTASQQRAQWELKVCDTVGFNTYFPLWNTEKMTALEELLNAGFQAIIMSVSEEKVGKRFLGQVLNKHSIAELQYEGLNLNNAQGEYHTIVFDGPIFADPLQILRGQPFYRDGFWYLDLHAV